MTTVDIEIPSSSTVIVVKRNLVSLKIVANKDEKATCIYFRPSSCVFRRASSVVRQQFYIYLRLPKNHRANCYNFWCETSLGNSNLHCEIRGSTTSHVCKKKAIFF